MPKAYFYGEGIFSVRFCRKPVNWLTGFPKPPYLYIYLRVRFSKKPVNCLTVFSKLPLTSFPNPPSLCHEH